VTGVQTCALPIFYREQGMLDGRWVDTLIMEKLL
jgi:hypothetical protein